MLWFSIELSDYGATIISQLNLCSLSGKFWLYLAVVLNTRIHRNIYIEYGLDKVVKGKSTISVIVMYFNRVAHMKFKFKSVCSLPFEIW